MPYKCYLNDKFKLLTQKNGNDKIIQLKDVCKNSNGGKNATN